MSNLYQKMSNSNRIDYIDVAKGLCMVLVVWQHTHTYYLDLETGEHWLESFRMPLFFLISGMFFKTYGSFTEFLKKKANTLIIPFLFFYLTLSVLLPNILYAIGYDGLRESSSLGWGSLFNCIFEKTYSNSPVWFLLALLWLNFLFYGICYVSLKIGESKYYLVASLSAFCGLIGFFLGVNKVFVWANIDNALTACPFFCFGYLLKKSGKVDNPPNTKILIWTIIIGLIITMLFSHGLSFKQNKWEIDDLLPLYGCGIIGSLSIIALSKIVESSRLLKFYGHNTLIILCMQMPVIQAVNLVTKRMGLNDMVEFLLTFVCVMLVFCIVIPVVNKYIPWFVGKRNLI